MMVVLMFGVTLLIPLAMRIVFSLGAPKRDTLEGEDVAMAMVVVAIPSPLVSSSSSSEGYSSCATKPFGGVFLVKLFLLGKDLALSLRMSFPLIVGEIHHEVTHIATIVASSYTLLAL